MRTRLLSSALLVGVLVSASGVARAQYYAQQPPPPPPPPSVYSADGISDWSPKSRLSDLSVMAWLPWYFGFGIGGEVRYEFYILPNGFIPTINDSFSLEPSIGLAYTSYGVVNYGWSIIDIAPALYGNWSFYFSNAFRLYVGLGLGYNIGVASAPHGYNGPAIGDSFFYWDLVGGLSYKFTRAIGLRAELGSQGAKAGLSFYF
jgi:hypothetical protein